MQELINILNEQFPDALRVAKICLPIVFSMLAFHYGIRWSLRFLSGDVVFYRDTKELDTKEPENFEYIKTPLN